MSSFDFIDDMESITSSFLPSRNYSYSYKVFLFNYANSLFDGCVPPGHVPIGTIQTTQIQRNLCLSKLNEAINVQPILGTNRSDCYEQTMKPHKKFILLDLAIARSIFEKFNNIEPLESTYNSIAEHNRFHKIPTCNSRGGPHITQEDYNNTNFLSFADYAQNILILARHYFSIDLPKCINFYKIIINNTLIQSNLSESGTLIVNPLFLLVPRITNEIETYLLPVFCSINILQYNDGSAEFVKIIESIKRYVQTLHIKSTLFIDNFLREYLNPTPTVSVLPDNPSITPIEIDTTDNPKSPKKPNWACCTNLHINLLKVL